MPSVKIIEKNKQNIFIKNKIVHIYVSYLLKVTFSVSVTNLLLHLELVQALSKRRFVKFITIRNLIDKAQAGSKALF